VCQRLKPGFERLARFGIVMMLLSLFWAAGLASAFPTERPYLSGTDKDNTVPWEFRVSAGRNSGVWTNIPVPSCWETMGFGTYEYGSDSTSEYGEYRRTFSVPANWVGKRVFLVFEGSMTDTETKVNGVAPGYVAPTNSSNPIPNDRALFTLHQGGFYEFSYEITSNVVYGASANLLEVKVSKKSANTSVNQAERQADYWVFGGIYRPVYLEMKPFSHIERLAVDARADGPISVSTYLSGITNNGTVAAFVTDSNNVPLGGEFSAAVAPGATHVILSTNLPSPNAWSAEFPNLYTLTVELRDGATAVHTVTNQIGFRTITFNNNAGFFVNGKKVILRGINRHEFWPTTGRTISRAISVADIELMKGANMNAVRLSHYPPSKEFLEECDRLGLYVLDELAGWQSPAYDNTIAPLLVCEMVVRDVNHPSIIAWDNGNEGGWNTSVDDDFALWDPQNRLVIHPTQGSTAFNGLITDHYENYNRFTNYLGAGKTVYMPTEHIHALYDGGGGACLADFWEAMRNAPNGGGIFLWALLDEGVINTDTGIIDVKGQSAPDGIVGPFREKEGSYYTVKALWNPVQVTAPSPATFAGSLAVENRYDFTSLNQCAFRWQLGWFPDPTDPASTLNAGFLAAVDSGSVSGPAVAPGSLGTLTLDVPADWQKYDALRLTVWDPFGRELYTWTWPLRTTADLASRVVGRPSASAPASTAVVTASEIIVTNGPRVFRFDLASGVINGVTISNQAVSFSNGPRPVSGAAWTVSSVTNYSDGTNVFIQVNDLATSPNAFQWRIRPDGWMKLKYRYTLTGPQNTIGVTFDYPTNQFTGMTWLGQGPFRVWKNRIAGQEVFVHAKATNNTWTGQRSGYNGWVGTQWSYPEFAGYHGQLYWASLATVEQPITVVAATSNLFLRVSTPPATDNVYENAVFPPGAISLLHGISAIGDKWSRGSSMAPSGATNIAAGLYTGETEFYFGALPPSGADRDRNGLADAWEFKHFGAIGQSPNADASGDSLPLMLENAFDLSPFVTNTASARLPHWTAGVSSPVALIYSVPLAQLDVFSFIPGLSDNLQQWFWADSYPGYFRITSTPGGPENAFLAEPNIGAWSGETNQLFLRLQIKSKK
jgi:hypothetical protein